MLLAEICLKSSPGPLATSYASISRQNNSVTKQSVMFPSLTKFLILFLVKYSFHFLFLSIFVFSSQELVPRKIFAGLVVKSAANMTVGLKKANPDFFRIFGANLNGLRGKIDQIRVIASVRRPDILLLQETKLCSNFQNSEFSIPGYSLFRKDRTASGGGVGMYVADVLRPIQVKGGGNFIWTRTLLC